MTGSQRYPLTWPAGWKRTQGNYRMPAAFGRSPLIIATALGTGRRSKVPLSVWDATGRLHGELERFGAANAILSTNIRLRVDGLPRSDGAGPSDPPDG